MNTDLFPFGPTIHNVAIKFHFMMLDGQDWDYWLPWLCTYQFWQPLPTHLLYKAVTLISHQLCGRAPETPHSL